MVFHRPWSILLLEQFLSFYFIFSEIPSQKIFLFRQSLHQQYCDITFSLSYKLEAYSVFLRAKLLYEHVCPFTSLTHILTRITFFLVFCFTSFKIKVKELSCATNYLYSKLLFQRVIHSVTGVIYFIFWRITQE